MKPLMRDLLHDLKLLWGLILLMPLIPFAAGIFVVLILCAATWWIVCLPYRWLVAPPSEDLHSGGFYHFGRRESP